MRRKNCPPVSAADNGKILGVDNGVWAKVDGGGGGGSAEIIHATVDYEHAESGTEFPLIIEESAAEIIAMSNPIIVCSYGTVAYNLFMYYKADFDGALTMLFSAASTDEMTLYAELSIDEIVSMCDELIEAHEKAGFPIFNTDGIKL